MMKPVVQKIKVKSVLTKSNLPVADFSVNPYVGCTHACKYCYACFMKRFTNHTENWGEFLDVKYWEPIKNLKKYEGKEFFFGSVTDPYNPQEEEFRRTRALLEELKGKPVINKYLSDINDILKTTTDLNFNTITLYICVLSPFLIIKKKIHNSELTLSMNENDFFLDYCIKENSIIINNQNWELVKNT